MKNKCDYYHTQKKIEYTYNPINGDPIPHNIDTGVCWGTKEIDECSCAGDRTKCDFYPEVREEAKKNLMFYGTFVDSDGIEDNLILGIDISKKDGSTIVVGRDVCGSCEIINRLWGDEAEAIYNKLIGK